MRRRSVIPDLDNSLNLDMLDHFNKPRGLIRRIMKAVKREVASSNIYGLDWEAQKLAHR